MTLYEIKTNTKYNSLEIYFTEKPDESTRETLKQLKFRWNPTKKCWYGFGNTEKVNEALGTSKGVALPDSEFVDGGGLYDGWRGGNNRKWNNDKELKAFLMEDFKKAGIKATVRFNRAGYLTSITATMTISESEIKDFQTFHDEYIAEGRWFNGCFGWLDYEEDGRHADIHQDKFVNLPQDEKAELLEKIISYAYKHAKERLTCSGTGHSDYKEILTESAQARFSTLLQIVASYNKDCSNSMVDYFDRDIYDHYCFKIA